jgi:hypothetical protein
MLLAVVFSTLCSCFASGIGQQLFDLQQAATAREGKKGAK